MKLDYKQKYLEMRSKLLESTDVAYRLGFEEGYKLAQQEAQAQMMQQQQEQQAMMAQQEAAMQGQEGEPSPEEMAMMEEQGMMPEQMPEQMPPEELPPEELQQPQNATELDEHIAELENLVAKGEKPSLINLRNKVEELKTLRKAQKETFKRKQQATTISQKKLVNNILEKWEKEANEKDELDKLIKETGLEIEG